MHSADLELFLALYESGSIHQTARSMFISASTISRRLRALELEVGAELFLRSAAGLQPTVSADILVPYAQRILSESATMTAALRGNDAAPPPVRVATTQALSQFVLAPALNRLLNEQLDGGAASVAVEMCSSDDVLTRVLADRADVGLTFAAGAAHGLREEAAAETGNAVIVDKSHPLADSTSVTISDLLDYPIAVERKGNTSRLLLDRAFAGLGRVFAPAVETGCPTTIATIIRGTDCVALFSDRVARADVFAGRFAQLRLDDPAVQPRRIRVVTRAGTARTEALSGVVAALAGELRS